MLQIRTKEKVIRTYIDEVPRNFHVGDVIQVKDVNKIDQELKIIEVKHKIHLGDKVTEDLIITGELC